MESFWGKVFLSYFCKKVLSDINISFPLKTFIFVREVMAGEVVVDALPYFDQGYDEEGVRDAVSYQKRVT